MKKAVFLGAAVLMIGIMLTACGSGNPTQSKTKTESTSAPESSQAQSEDKENQQVVHGIINKIDTYLVLVTENGEYQVMDYGEGVTLDDFSEGDSVDVTYTGTLGKDDETPVITAIQKVK